MASADEVRPVKRRRRRDGGAGPRVGIREVAKAAGVSMATASRAISGTGSVSNASRQRVLRAVQDLGYRPDRVARAFARRRSGTVGVLLLDFASGFVGEVMAGLAKAAREVGRDALFASYGGQGHSGVRRELDRLLGARVEGIVFYPSISLPIDDAALVADLKRVPTVLVDCAVDGLDLPVVTSDGAGGVQQAVDHLVSLGHERIGHLAGPSWTSTGVVRLRAFREAMAARGLDIPNGRVAHYDFSYVQALTAAQSMLQERPLPTAVIAANDRGAAAFMAAAKHAGLRIPHDLSVIGYSDTEICQVCDPPLTTVRQPKEELGREAMRILAALIEGDSTTDGSGIHLLPTQLVVRGSCGPYMRREEAADAIARSLFVDHSVASSPSQLPQGKEGVHGENG